MSKAPVSPARDRAATVAMLAAVQLLAWAAATELGATIGFAVGRALSVGAVVAGAAVAAAIAAGAARRSGVRDAVAASALTLAVFAGALLLAAGTLDVSWDGQAYQQSGVLALARGWNPLGRPLPIARPEWTDFVVNHYAKGPWIRGAALVVATGNVELGKAWNFVLAAGAGFGAVGALLSIPGLPGVAAVAAGCLAALNPVFPPQMFTYYVDAQLASVLTALVALVAAFAVAGGLLPACGIAAAVMLLPGIKLTGAVYAIAFGAASVLAIGVMARQRARAATLAVAAGLLLGLLVTGWNPYVTNWARNGHPLYPVAGPGAMDVMENQAPRAFLERSRLAKLATATFSASRNRNTDLPTLKVPFTVKGDEWTVFQHPDPRYGGFGPFFSGALLLSFVALAATARRARRAALIAGAAAAVLLASVLANPESWWARYVPQLWLVPVVLAVGAVASRSRAAALAGAVTLVALAADAGVVAVNAANRVRKNSAETRAQLRTLAREPAPIAVKFVFPSNRQRLMDAGVPFTEVDALPCSNPEFLQHSITPFCRGAATPGAPPR